MAVEHSVRGFFYWVYEAGFTEALPAFSLFSLSRFSTDFMPRVVASQQRSDPATTKATPVQKELSSFALIQTTAKRQESTGVK